MENQELIQRIRKTSNDRALIDARLIGWKVDLEDRHLNGDTKKKVEKAVTLLENSHKEFFKIFPYMKSNDENQNGLNNTETG